MIKIKGTEPPILEMKHHRRFNIKNNMLFGYYFDISVVF
jgi:hypothetical protein